MQIDSTLEVHLPSYSVWFRLLSENLLYMKREIRSPQQYVDTDVFGKCWSFSIAQLKSEQVAVKRHGKLLTTQGNIAIFLPPFSIVEWHVKPGTFYWETLFSDNQPPASFPKEPVIFYTPHSLPSSPEEISRIMSGENHYMAIGREEKLSAIARKTKEILDKSYREKISIANIAKYINCSHSVMTRAFKNCYGMSPVTYRNKLRITDSLSLMLMGNYSVSETAFSVGFEDLSQYNKQFRKQNLTVPSQFK